MRQELFLVASLLLGWVAVWPTRRSLDAVLFHCLAMLFGLMTWLGPALLLAVLGRPWTRVPAIAAAVAFSLLAAALFSLASRGAAGSPPAAWTFPVAAAAVGGMAAWQIKQGFSIVSFDSYGHWAATGIWLSEVGRLEPWIMSGRSFMVPSWMAAERLFGGVWAGAVFPVLGMVLLLLLARLLWGGPLSRLPAPARVAVALLVPALLAWTVPFRYHALLVHTHMAEAVFLLGSVGCLAIAAVERHGEGPSIAPLLAAAGLLAGGFALVRPDGPAYLAVPMGLFAALWLGGAIEAPSAWFWLPLLVPLWASYGIAFAKLGLWPSGDKLTGAVALLVIGGLSVIPAVVTALRRAPFAQRAFRRPADVMRLVAALEAAGLLALLCVKPGNVVATAGNMAGDLFSGGGQGFVWYLASGLLLAAVLFPGIRRRVVFGNAVLFSIVQFLAVALAVHSTGHVGRVAMNDSFNRVSFHVLPFVFWYLGAMAGACLGLLLPKAGRLGRGEGVPDSASPLQREA